MMLGAQPAGRVPARLLAPCVSDYCTSMGGSWFETLVLSEKCTFLVAIQPNRSVNPRISANPGPLIDVVK